MSVPRSDSIEPVDDRSESSADAGGSEARSDPFTEMTPRFGLWATAFGRRYFQEFAFQGDDAERLRVDAIFGQLIGGRAAAKAAASVGQMSRFETGMLASRGNFHALQTLDREWVERAGSFTPKRSVVLDLDSSESPTYGEQEGSAYNDHPGHRFLCDCCTAL